MTSKIKAILVPVDFSACSRRAFEWALEIARAFGASVDVLHAWTAPAYVSPTVAVLVGSGSPAQTLEAIARQEASRQLAEFLNSFGPIAGVPVKTRIEFGFEADVIVAAAQAYDLVVIGTHGRKGISHLIMGSVAEKVIRRATCPVLTVRDASQRPEHEESRS